jgi:NADH-quinone oxidoreductase subunit N
VNGAQITALLPIIGVAASSVVLMILVTIRRSRTASLLVTLAGLAASFGLVAAARPVAPTRVTTLLVIDQAALFFIALVIVATGAVALLATDYLARRRCDPEEFYLLLLFAALGSCVLAASTHFASLFLGLEVLSVSLYAMVAYSRDTDTSLEAGVKYLILAAVSSAFLLFGMALVYAETGSLEIGVLAGLSSGPPLMIVTGLALVMVGVGFKLALVPFHMWTADVYQGAPAPVTAFVATASKAAVVALLLRVLAAAGRPGPQLLWFMALLAAASILVGNLLALRQDNVKRLLAYSSIAHLGYLMIAVVAGGADSSAAAAFYLAAYVPTTLGAFGVITVLSSGERDADRLADVVGLGRRRPVFAGLLTVTLLSLAGIPLTAGFIGKFLVLRSGVAVGQWALALILVLGSVISIFYYLRVVVAMYMKPAAEDAPELPAVPILAGATLAVMLAVILWLGVWPGPFLEVIRSSVNTLF